jgi:hypothetical protein
MSKYNILILGASYDSLLASKPLFGGHSIWLDRTVSLLSNLK